jgi:hypothetical protein
MTEHPMQPTPEKFGEWLAEACRRWPSGRPGDIAGVVARAAYAAGADAQLEACEKWVGLSMPNRYVESLHAAMRPKPPSLKQKALTDLSEIGSHYIGPGAAKLIDTIRRALESLPDD